MAKIVKNNLGNFLVVLLIFSIVTGWIFSAWPQIFNFPPKIQQAWATQYARPNADELTGNWFELPLYAKIDEESYDDGDYVTSGTNPSSDIFEVNLIDVSDPESSSDHTVRYRARTTKETGLIVRLMQGGSEIANQTPSLTALFQEFSFTLTSIQADSITNYTDLRLRFEANGAKGTKQLVSWAVFEVPDAANQAPTFSADPNDPREDPDSTCTSPTNDGSTITFRATATDGESDSWKLLICKADEAPTPSSTDPVCGASGQWCRDDSFRGSEAESTCQYTVLAGDYETKDWYAFACDNNASPACSLANQGGVDSVSPFTVNRIPSFTVFSDDSPVNPNATVTWSTTASDDDTGGTCASDTISLYVCQDNDFTGTACGVGGTWCSSLNDPDGDPTCNTAAPRPDGNWAAYGFVIDNHNFEASPQGGDSVLAVNNVAPSIANTSIVLKDSDGAGRLIPKDEEAETTGFTVEFIVTDDNSCKVIGGTSTEINSAITHVYRSGVLQANCDDDGEDDTDSCYANAHAGTGGSCAQDTSIDDCTDNTDTTVGWKCTFPLNYHADPTYEANTEFESETWMASVKATDDDTLESSLVEDNDGNEMESFMSYDLVTTSIDYSGPLDPGATSDDEITNVEATGNVGIDVNVYSAYANMCVGFPACAGATMAIAQQHYDFIADPWDDMQTLTETDTDELELDVPKTRSETSSPPADADVHWKIKIPADQAGGTYDGENTIAGKPGEAAGW